MHCRVLNGVRAAGESHSSRAAARRPSTVQLTRTQRASLRWSSSCHAYLPSTCPVSAGFRRRRRCCRRRRLRIVYESAIPAGNLPRCDTPAHGPTSNAPPPPLPLTGRAVIDAPRPALIGQWAWPAAPFTAAARWTPVGAHDAGDAKRTAEHESVYTRRSARWRRHDDDDDDDGGETTTHVGDDDASSSNDPGQRRAYRRSRPRRLHDDGRNAPRQPNAQQRIAPHTGFTRRIRHSAAATVRG